MGIKYCIKHETVVSWFRSVFEELNQNTRHKVGIIFNFLLILNNISSGTGGAKL